MITSIVGFLALAAATGAKEAIVSPQPDPIKVYLICVKEKGLKLIPSGEPATVIADVAVSTCEPLIEPAAVQVDLEAAQDPIIQRYQRQYGHLTGGRRETLAQLRVTAKQLAIQSIVERKALIAK